MATSNREPNRELDRARELVGRRALLPVHNQAERAATILVEVWVLEVSYAFGRVLARVSPVSGSGDYRVEYTKLRLVD